MRILIISNELGTALEYAQLLLAHEPSTSITITDEVDAQELIDYNGYTHILKRPTLKDIKELLC